MAGRPLEPRPEIRRVGLVTRLFEQADSGIAAVCAEAARLLAPDAEPVELPLHEEISTITQLVMLPEAAAVHLPWLRTKLADYGADVRARALAGLLLPSTAYVTGLRARNWARDLWERELGEYDLLVAPAASMVAPRLDAIPSDYRLSVMPYNSPASLARAPGHERAVRVRRRPPGRPVADGPPRRRRPHPAGRRGVPAGDRLAPAEPG